MTPGAFLLIPAASALICALLILLLRPLLIRYAMARPNARSSHTIPTPQGGGIAVIVATLAVALLAIHFAGFQLDPSLLILFASTIFIASVGAVDDLHQISVWPRLLLQIAAIGAVLASIPEAFRLFGFLPLWMERTVLLVAALWFVNLVNFMDGLDWMTAAEIVPIATALALFGAFDDLSATAMLIALALAGAMIGFAPFNRPVAKLFLGDVGSLPIGLLTGWCLLQLAGNGHLTAAVLLPLYYLGDATVTLLRRIGKGEQILMAHRSHFYQHATANGFRVMQVVAEVFALNIALAILAAITIFKPSPGTSIIALAIGCMSVALVLIRFSRPRAAA